MECCVLLSLQILVFHLSELKNHKATIRLDPISNINASIFLGKCSVLEFVIKKGVAFKK